MHTAVRRIDDARARFFYSGSRRDAKRRALEYAAAYRRGIANLHARAVAHSAYEYADAGRCALAYEYAIPNRRAIAHSCEYARADRYAVARPAVADRRAADARQGIANLYARPANCDADSREYARADRRARPAVADFHRHAVPDGAQAGR